MVGVYNKGLLYTIFLKKGWERVGMFFTLKVHRVILSHWKLYMDVIDIWGYDISIMFLNMILMHDMA